jgi:hypothetical protein
MKKKNSEQDMFLNIKFIYPEGYINFLKIKINCLQFVFLRYTLANNEEEKF